MPALNRLVRERLAQRFRVPSEFDRFIIDFFPGCIPLMPHAGDRVAKENVLLLREGSRRVLRALDGPIWWMHTLLRPVLLLAMIGGINGWLWYYNHSLQYKRSPESPQSPQIAMNTDMANEQIGRAHV